MVSAVECPKQRGKKESQRRNTRNLSMLSFLTRTNTNEHKYKYNRINGKRSGMPRSNAVNGKVNAGRRILWLNLSMLSFGNHYAMHTTLHIVKHSIKQQLTFEHFQLELHNVSWLNTSFSPLKRKKYQKKEISKGGNMKRRRYRIKHLPLLLPPPPPLPPCCSPPLLRLAGRLQGSWFCPCAHPGGGNIKRRKYENRDIWKELREKQHHCHFTNRKMKHRCHL